MRKIFFIILLTAFTFYIFRGLTKTFYQQDEWYGLGEMLLYGPKTITLNLTPIKIILGEGRVLANVLIYTLVWLHPFSITGVSLYAIFFHTLCGILVFFLAEKTFKNSWLSFLTALFFIVNGVSQGSVTWVASSMGTINAAFVILLSVFTLFKYIENNKNVWLILTFILLYLSLMFKETGIFLFLFYPIYFYFLKKESLKKTISKFWPFLVMFLTIISYRAYEFLSIPVDKNLFITGASTNAVLTIVIRFIMYPLTSFSLIYVPPNILFYLAKRVVWNYYSFLPASLYDLVAQTSVIDMMAVLITLILGFILFIFLRKKKDSLKSGILFWIGFEIASFLPYIMISKSFSYLESRYYYLAAISAGFILSFLILKLQQRFRFKGLLVGLTLAFLFLNFHFKTVNREILNQQLIGYERKDLLNGIVKIRNTFSKRQVFYLTGDRNFYISEGNPVPMQGGMGYSLLTWYIANGKTPQELKPLLGKHFLWGLNEQGYQEENGFGYGYFWNKEKLTSAIKENKLKKEDVVGLFYNSGKREIVDITSTLSNLPYAR